MLNIAGKKLILLVKKMVTSNFLLVEKKKLNMTPEFVQIFDIISLFAAEMEGPKIGISGKGLICMVHQRDA